MQTAQGRCIVAAMQQETKAKHPCRYSIPEQKCWWETVGQTMSNLYNLAKEEDATHKAKLRKHVGTTPLATGKLRQKTEGRGARDTSRVSKNMVNAKATPQGGKIQRLV